MNSNELRLGNKLDFYTEEANLIGVSEEYLSHWIADGLVWNSIDEYKPIPITEEWLLKFGFKIIIHDETKYHELFIDEIGITLLEGDKNGYLDVLINEHSNIRMRYIHQLQNIYFALTGTELKCAP